MPSIYEGNLSKKMVKQVNRNTLAKKRADKLKKDKEKYPLPTVIKQGMNNTIKQSNASARAENNQRTMVTNLIMDKYKMPYDEAKSAYETILVPYQREQEKTAKRASFIGDKYNLDTLFTSKRDSPGLESARSLTNMLNPTEGKLEENPYFKQGVSMEGFLSTTNAGRGMSDPNAKNRYRYAGDAAAGRADTPYNSPTFQQQFKDIKAAFEEDPRLMAEVVGMSLAQDFVKTALPIAANAVPGGAALANTEMGKDLNRGIMQFALDNAPVSDAAKYTVKGDWLADPTLTSYIDPALLALSVGTGGVSGAFPITSKLLKAGKAVAKSEKTAKVAGNVRDAGGVLAGTVLSAGGMGGMSNIGKAQKAADLAKSKYEEGFDVVNYAGNDALVIEDYKAANNLYDEQRSSFDLSDKEFEELRLEQENYNKELLSNLSPEGQRRFSLDTQRLRVDKLYKYATQVGSKKVILPPEGKPAQMKLSDVQALQWRLDGNNAEDYIKLQMDSGIDFAKQDRDIYVQIKPYTEEPSRKGALTTAASLAKKYINRTETNPAGKTLREIEEAIKSISDPKQRDKALKDFEKAVKESEEELVKNQDKLIEPSKGRYRLVEVRDKNAKLTDVEEANAEFKGDKVYIGLSDHMDHIIPKSMIKQRVFDLLASDDPKYHALAMKYVKFMNSPDNFAELHGRINSIIKKDIPWTNKEDMVATLKRRVEEGVLSERDMNQMLKNDWYISKLDNANLKLRELLDDTMDVDTDEELSALFQYLENNQSPLF